jgi:hypothetical protein
LRVDRDSEVHDVGQFACFWNKNDGEPILLWKDAAPQEIVRGEKTSSVFLQQAASSIHEGGLFPVLALRTED